MTKQQLARLWIALACVSLLLSGALAMVITSAKMPWVKAHLPDLEVVRWCLVTHVNLATLVWFTAVPVGLLYFAAAGSGSRATRVQLWGFTASCLGILLMILAFPTPAAEPVLANYIPVVLHPQHLLGLALYLVGVAANFLSPSLFWPKSSAPVKELPGLAESRFGLWIGATFYLLALVAIVGALAAMRGLFGELPARTFTEIVMWGGGHLLQHSSATFLMICWILLLSGIFQQALFSRRELFPVFAWLGLPILFVPILLWLDPASDAYREGFTQLMRWGIFPPVLFLCYRLFRKFLSQKGQKRLRSDYRLAATALSLALLLMGFVYGALIRGPDLRVPGHYHSTIGAVTVAFMALSYRILSTSESPWIRRAIWTYGLGQMMFATGMFIAGTFGLGRKTYGSEHVFTHPGQYIGMGTMAIGGLIAFAGGFLFAFAVIPCLKDWIKPRLALERLALKKVLMRPAFFVIGAVLGSLAMTFR